MTRPGWQQSNTLPVTMLALPVETAKLQHQDAYYVARVFTGRVEARRESPLGFESAGLLAQVLVREGDTVERDQLIAVLDKARLQAQRDELMAAKDEAEARLALADATLKRTRGIVDQGGV